MDTIWRPTRDKVPQTYWLAATLVSVVVVGCYATAYWFPYFAVDWATSLVPTGLGTVGLTVGGLLVGIFGLLVGAGVSAAAWLALRWPWLGISLAALPIVPSVLDGTPVAFGVIAGLAAVAVTAGWRNPPAAAASVGLAALIVVGWLASGRAMAAPFRATIETSYYGTGRLVTLGVVYVVALAVVLAGALALRRSVHRSIEHEALTARAADVESQALVTAERARLARDLHDVVAHHVSLIAVRAETAPYTHSGISADGRAVLSEIASDARLALDELRGVLGILSRSADAADTAPQPTWADISVLVERVRAAGLSVDLTGDVEASAGAASGYAAYRVVQESLTNSRRHAPGCSVRVSLATTGALLTVRVVTVGGTGVPAATPGRGLVGMRERVEGLGGTLRAGPEGADFVVEATLPRGLTR